VNVGFSAKGEGKSQAAIEHERLADAEAGGVGKAFWRAHLAELKGMLER